MERSESENILDHTVCNFKNKEYEMHLLTGKTIFKHYAEVSFYVHF